MEDSNLIARCSITVWNNDAIQMLAVAVITVVPMCAQLQGQSSAQPQTSGQAESAHATDVSGTWQGKLQLPGNGGQAGQTLRIVLKVSKTPDGGWSALNYSIDQGSQPSSTAGVRLEGHTFKYSVPAYGAGYEGQLSADGNVIVGRWAQTMSLDFVRAPKEGGWEIPAAPEPLKPMTEANPSFEVATIKPSDPSKPGKYFRVVGRTYSTHGTTLMDLIQVAYGLNSQQIVAPQRWMHDDPYDLTGTPDAAGEPNGTQWLLMMQKLLATRFGLVVHHDQQERSVYVLSVAKGGPKNLTANSSGGLLPGMEFQPVSGGVSLPARNATMEQFAQMMQQVVLDRPVVDHTGLTGKFDFQLTFMPDETQFGGRPPVVQRTGSEAAPDLAEALQRQIGLRLAKERIPTDVIVVDHVERPSAN
jgi:uncharacterized protein (TIGR03435 family)